MDGVIKGVFMTKKLLNEKMLLISIIGILEALKEGGVSINEAEKYLFSPHMAQVLKEKEFNKSIIEVIEKGCELEDIASLLPQKSIDSIEELKQEALTILKRYEVFEQKFWI